MAARAVFRPTLRSVFDAVGVTSIAPDARLTSSTSSGLLVGELELRVGNGLERAPVQRRDPDLLNRLAMLGVE